MRFGRSRRSAVISVIAWRSEGSRFYFTLGCEVFLSGRPEGECGELSLEIVGAWGFSIENK